MDEQRVHEVLWGQERLLAESADSARFSVASGSIIHHIILEFVIKVKFVFGLLKFI